jgi:uncharacterized protein (DUF2249 family)
LIQSILKPQPSQRATIETIKIHSWINQNGLPPLQFVDASFRNPTETITQMEHDNLIKLGFQDVEVEEFLRKESPCSIKAALYLVRELLRPRSMPTVEWKEVGPKSAIPVTVYPDTQNLFSRIRKDRLEAKRPQAYSIDDRPSVVSTFEHTYPRQKTHLLILRNLQQLGGKLTDFDDEDPSTLYASLSIREPTFQLTDLSDPDIAACLSHADAFEMLFKASTDQTSVGKFQTTFELLNGYDKEWVFEQFDNSVQLLVRDVK